MPPAEARRRILSYLDQALFARHDDPYHLFGLTPDCDPGAIRARHKQLLQVFHPDRHPEDESQWFTARTEQLNRAYALLKANHGKPRSASPPPPRPTTARPTRETRRHRRRFRIRAAFPGKARLRRRLKARLGDPARLQRRLYIALVAVPVILIALLYWRVGQPAVGPAPLTHEPSRAPIEHSPDQRDSSPRNSGSASSLPRHERYFAGAAHYSRI